MANSKSFFESKAFKNIMAKVYGIGAAVVIVGALFKLMHWPGAGAMLVAGLGTEALIFLVSAFEPVHEEYDWTRVYPELAGVESDKNKAKKDNKKSVSSELDKMLAEAKIESKLINNLGEGMKSFSDNVAKMSKITEATVATEAYTKNIKDAAVNVEKINKSYGSAIDALNQMSAGSTASKKYYEEVQNATKQLSSLNSVYESGLKDSDKHIKSLNNYYAILSQTAEKLAKSGQSTEHIHKEFDKLSKNLSSLNAVYGNMLTAMGANQAANR